MNPGDILDNRYEIVSRLGAGGMGEVYKAVHTHLGAPRVIKVIHANISSSTDAKDRFLREARTATKVHHPNVATLHDFSSQPDGSHYMVWEFIDGENLAQRLRGRGTLPPRQAIHIVQQALAGLDAVHRAGIVHRDISPENLMITTDDTVKIIDMGVAKVEDAGAVSQTRTGIFVGKLRYAAPEQLGFIPEGEKIDGRADIYAMAMVLFEILTGRPPYEAKSPHEYFMLHARPQVEKTVELPPNMLGGAAIQEVLEKALARDRTQRYATAREFASALELVELRLPTEVDELTAFTGSQTDSTMRLSRETSITQQQTAQRTAQHTAPPTVAAALPPPPSSAPTVLTPLPQQQPLPPTQYAHFPQSRPKSGSMLPLVIIGVLLFFVAAAVAAVMFWPGKKEEAQVAETTTTATTTTGQTATTTTQQQGQIAEASVTVTSATTPAETPVTTTTAEPPVVVENTQTVQRTGGPGSIPPVIPRRRETVAETTTIPTPPPVDTRGSENADDDGRAGLGSAPRYVDGGDDEAGNERALESLRRALRGTKSMSLRGGGMRDELYRAMRDQLPDMDFDGEADVIVRFEGANDRVGRVGRKRRSAQATVSKNGRVVFRYELPPEDYRVGDSAAEAFARVIANAVE
ncbi:MAG TPA: serine/threonine-protein kinase [Thermoanaerobaculia bacterium]|nr:serine/threonine-protein kinase [Thermoanaerobaculia bacterium]